MQKSLASQNYTSGILHLVLGFCGHFNAMEYCSPKQIQGCFGWHELQRLLFMELPFPWSYTYYHYYNLLVTNDIFPTNKGLCPAITIHTLLCLTKHKLVNAGALSPHSQGLWRQREVHKLSFFPSPSHIVGSGSRNCSPRYHLLCWDNCPWVEAHQEEELKLFPRTQGQWTVQYKRWWISIFPQGSAYDRARLD